MLTALERSHSVNDVEKQLKQLFIAIFDDLLLDKFTDASYLGAPTHASFEQLKISAAFSGLEHITTGLTKVQLQHLYKIWSTRNQDRGFYFFNAILQAFFPNRFTIAQVWHSKALTYPSNPLPANDPDAFLTSRINITIFDLDGNIIDSPKLRRMATHILPARIVPIFVVNTSLDELPNNGKTDNFSLTIQAFEVGHKYCYHMASLES
jgi:hypothetical protein